MLKVILTRVTGKSWYLVIATTVIVALLFLALQTTNQAEAQETPSGDESCPASEQSDDNNEAPTPVRVDVQAVPIVVDSTTEEYFVLYVQHDVDGNTVEIPVSVTVGGIRYHHARRKCDGAAQRAL